MPWQFWVGPAVGLCGVIFAIYAYNKNRKPKRLQYSITADEELVSTSRHSRWADLRVSFDNLVLTRPRIVAVQIRNSGAVELRPEDYAEPFRVEVLRATPIAGTVVLHDGSSPGKDLVGVEIEDDHLCAPRVLLNPGEYLEFRLLVDGAGPSPQIHGRAAGFQLAAATTSRRRTPGWWRMVGLQAAVLVVLVAGTALFSWRLGPHRVPAVVGRPVADAVVTLNHAEVDVRSVDRVRDPAPAGTVISVSPGKGTLVGDREGVTLVVSDGP